MDHHTLFPMVATSWSKAILLVHWQLALLHMSGGAQARILEQTHLQED
jgi:hypothetical protein